MVPGGSLDSADSHRSYFSSIHPSPFLGKTQHIIVHICTYLGMIMYTAGHTHAHIHTCKVCSIKTSVVVYGGLREGGGKANQVSGVCRVVNELSVHVCQWVSCQQPVEVNCVIVC